MSAALLPLAFVLSLAPQRAAEEPIVAVGVWYAGPGAQPPATATGDIAALRRDLGAIRRAGFNALTTWITWRDAEPGRGAYALAGAERLIAAAAEADLKVSVVLFTNTAPAWAAEQAHASAQFLTYVTKRLAVQPGVLQVAEHTTAMDAAPRRITVRPGGGPDGRLAMWEALARGERAIAFHGSDDPLGPAVLSLGETAGVVTRNESLFIPLRPRSDGVVGIAAAAGGAPIEVRLLESAAALMIVGLNYSPAPRTATITFSPEIPEAIWQNLETGAAVNFVMGKRGPVLEHTFAPRDALVLMIRKKFR
jgi:hypothetical protein